MAGTASNLFDLRTNFRCDQIHAFDSNKAHRILKIKMFTNGIVNEIEIRMQDLTVAESVSFWSILQKGFAFQKLTLSATKFASL